MRKAYLYTPIPPARTGTADYFDTVLSEISKALVPPEQIRIVVGDDQEELALTNARVHGYAIQHYRTVPNVLRADELRVFFLANNTFHLFIHRALHDVRKRAGKGKVVSVVHEPSCFMLMNAAGANGWAGFTDDDLHRSMIDQFGASANSLLHGRRRDLLPQESEFWITALGHALRNSDEIWTHSRFAELKLRLETHGRRKAPRFVVSKHPDHPGSQAATTTLASHDYSANKRLEIGVFGWVTPPKRTEAILTGLAMALQTVTPARRAEIRMNVVGEIPKGSFDPIDFANRLGLQDVVRFTGYVSRQDLETHIQRSSLVFNLRFPSCGESSGTLQRAIDAGIPIVTSDYQAFREAPAAFFVPVMPELELAAIFAVFHSAFHGQLQLKNRPASERRKEVSQLIIEELST